MMADEMTLVSLTDSCWRWSRISLAMDRGKGHYRMWLRGRSYARAKPKTPSL